MRTAGKEEPKLMNQEITILIAEDDDGHAELIQKNLRRAGIVNTIVRFSDGREALNFLCKEGKPPHLVDSDAYILLLDIRMPGLDGIEVLKKIKGDSDLKKIPVIMLTTTDDPREVAKCHEIGCSNYITKPVAYESFVDAVHKLGLFLTIVKVPSVNGIT